MHIDNAAKCHDVGISKYKNYKILKKYTSRTGLDLYVSSADGMGKYQENDIKFDECFFPILEYPRNF